MQERSVNAVSLVTAPLGGRLFWLATAADGTVTRLDDSGNAAPLSEPELAQAAARTVGPNGVSAQGILREEDAYYFSHHDRVVLPAYRIIANDAEHTRYYLDPTSGALLGRADLNARWHRWLFAGLHRIDFAAWLRARPAWDIIVITRMLGGVAAGATGLCLAARRIRSDVIMLVRLATGARSDGMALRMRSLPQPDDRGTLAIGCDRGKDGGKTRIVPGGFGNPSCQMLISITFTITTNITTMAD